MQWVFTNWYLLIETLPLYISAPDGPPTSVRGGYTNRTAIFVTWKAIPMLSRNGIIVNYNVAYKQKDLLESWKIISVGPQTFRADISHLQYNKIYDVKVAGRTAIGVGPYSAAIAIRTDAYGMQFIIPSSFLLSTGGRYFFNFDSDLDCDHFQGKVNLLHQALEFIA